MKIKIINPVFSELIGPTKPLEPVLSFKAEYFVQGQFRKKKRAYRKSIIIKDGERKLIHTGLIPKILDYCDRFGLPIEVASPVETFSENFSETKIDIAFRNYQVEAIEAAKKAQRGVIVAPTGSGKTITFAGIISSFEPLRTLILVQGRDLFYQTCTRMQQYFPGSKIALIGDGHCDLSGAIFIGMIQTLKNLDYSEYKRWFNSIKLLIVDEAHHVSSFSGIYVKFLEKVPAPLRFGVTATLPVGEEANLAREAILGPVIHETKMDSLIETGNLAKPKLKLIRLPKEETIRQATRYQDVYEKGVVKNRGLNRRVVSEAYELAQQGLTSLIIVTRRDHGRNLEAAAATFFADFRIKYVEGPTDIETRRLALKALNQKELESVICTTVWKEAVDIPTLGAIINAAGGKSELATLQSLGRGLRVAEGKNQVIFIDFFNSSHWYLVSHFGERLSLYFDLGWL